MVVTVSNISDVPSVSISGPASLTSFAPQSFSLSAFGSVSSCASSKYLSYSWSVYQNLVYNSSLVSISKNPSQLLLNKYTLVPGNTYLKVVTVTTPSGYTASASVNVFVAHDVLVAKIAGGLLLLLLLCVAIGKILN